MNSGVENCPRPIHRPACILRRPPSSIVSPAPLCEAPNSIDSTRNKVTGPEVPASNTSWTATGGYATIKQLLMRIFCAVDLLNLFACHDLLRLKRPNNTGYATFPSCGECASVSCSERITRQNAGPARAYRSHRSHPLRRRPRLSESVSAFRVVRMLLVRLSGV